jgi:predicted chitinase
MLISPPFLPAREPNQSDDDWLTAAMRCGMPGDGAFPVSFQLGWHGGVHLTAPMNGAAAEHVRAIADGTVVYVRAPAPRVDDPHHAQNYRGWTDNGCVVLRHETAIGTGANAENVVFLSLYMHLSHLSPSLVAGRRVYRKDDLGQAGQIYGATQRKIHFEIVCDDANLRKLAGRSAAALDQSRDGRSDAWFGALYFALPEGTQVFDVQPMPQRVAAHRQPPRAGAHGPLPAPVALSPAHVTDRQLIVEMRYGEGEGQLDRRGDLTITTRETSGTPIAAPLREEDAEYRLFESASTIASAFAAAAAPAQTTVFELLRFGRRINETNEAAMPATLPHWRRISYPGGTGWVNLGAAAIRKFSDADLPDWCGWSLIDDAADGDSRCDSATVRGWLDTDGDGAVTLAEARAAMNDAVVAAKLAKSVCKFPSEWDAATIDARWSWLKSATPENPEPLTDDDFAELKAHITAFCIDDASLHAAQWHWHPREFMRHFRRCSWLSVDELAQMLPRRSGPAGAQAAPIPWATARSRMDTYAVELNLAMRKFGIVSRTRQVHFLAQTYIETALWRTMEELGRAHQQRNRRTGLMYWPAPAMQYYQAFFGRGAMQLTWAGNYDGYGIYRAFPSVAANHRYVDDRITHTSTHYWADPRDRNGRVIHAPRPWFPRFDPHDVASNPFYACDSAGFYWTSKNTGGGRININRVADQGVTSDAVGRASVLVNGGGYGFVERQGYAVYVQRYLGDAVETDATRSFNVTYRGRNYDVYVDFTPQRPR